MGSWSVYCGISNIAITAGHECVLIPIRKRKYTNGGTPWLPHTLPIFGTYDDYGGLEDIEKNANTELIEKHFGVSIEDFVFFYTRGIHCPDETKASLRRNKELKKTEFMFVDRKVYDFMKIHEDNEIKFGDEGLLTNLGFTYLGEETNPEIYDPKRYNQCWIKDGKKFYSDGTYLHYGNTGIYYPQTLASIVSIDKDCRDWKLLSRKAQINKLSWIIGCEDWYLFEMWSSIEKTLSKDPTRAKYLKEICAKTNGIGYKYVDNLAVFGEGMYELICVYRNMQNMSGWFQPYEPYVTPQCGEFKEHQRLLEGFAEINKSYIKDWE